MMNIQANEETKMKSIHFESLSELLDYNSDLDSVPPFANKRKLKAIMSEHKADPVKWYGGSRTNAQDVIDDALRGWNEGYNTAVEYSGKLNMDDQLTPYQQITQQYKRRHIRNGYGDELDIHRVYQGQLDKAWSRTIREKMDNTHQLFTLFIDTGGSFSLSAESTLWRASIAVRITDQMIKLGKSVKIIIGSCVTGLTYDESRYHSTSIVVKQYNEPLSLERLAAMSNIGFHRVFNFMARTMFGTVIDQSMGRPTEVLRNTPPAQMVDEVEKGNTRYIYIGHCNNQHAAEEEIGRIYDQLKEYAKK